MLFKKQESNGKCQKAGNVQLRHLSNLETEKRFQV